MVHVPYFLCHLCKMSLALTVSIMLLVPLSLVHIPNATSKPLQTVVTNDSLDILNQITCRMPKPSLNLKNQEVTDALNLPPGSLPSDDLREIGKCKALNEKLKWKRDCFCLGFWPIHICSLAIMMSGVVSLSDLIYTFSLPEQLQDRKRLRKHSAYNATLFLIVLFVIICFILHTDNAIRYTLPQHVYDQAYYYTPPTWWLTVGLVAIYLCPITFLERIIYLYDDWRISFNPRISPGNKPPATPTRPQALPQLPSTTVDRVIVVQIENGIYRPTGLSSTEPADQADRNRLSTVQRTKPEIIDEPTVFMSSFEIDGESSEND